MNNEGEQPESSRTSTDLQVATVNTIMGSLLSLFNAIIVTQYFTDLVWVVVLIVVVSAIVLTVVRRLSLERADWLLSAMMLTISCLFAYALFQRSMNTKIPVSTEVFWPVAPVLIYIVWMILLEVVLTRKI